MARTTQIAVRLEAELVDQIDALVTELAKATISGLEPTRTAVVRAAIARGLAEMRHELNDRTKRASKR